MGETLSEIVEREAAEAEEEETIEGTDEDLEADGPGEDTEARAAAVAEAERAIDLDKRERDLKGEDRRHENALKRAYGDDFALRTRCAACDGEGFVELTPDLLHLLVELGQGARTALGEAGADLPQAPFAQACPDCIGYGELVTGSKTQHGATIVCRRCEGKGWIDLDAIDRNARLGIPPAEGNGHAVQYPVYHGLEQTLQTPAQVPQSPPDGWESMGRPGADTWGRWPGHTNYGRNPEQGGW